MYKNLDTTISKINKFGNNLISLAILSLVIILFSWGNNALINSFIIILYGFFIIAFFSGLKFINELAKIDEINYGIKLIGYGIFSLFVIISLIGLWALASSISVYGFLVLAILAVTIIFALGFIYLGIGLRKFGSLNACNEIKLGGELLIAITIISIISAFLQFQFLTELLSIIAFYELGRGFKKLYEILVNLKSNQELINELQERLGRETTPDALESIAREKRVPVIFLQILFNANQ